jgi:hypothetical protein
MATGSALSINKALSVRCMQQAAVNHRLKYQYALVHRRKFRGDGGSGPPTFWSGDGPLHFLMSKKPTKILVPHFSNQSYATALVHQSLGISVRC